MSVHQRMVASCSAVNCTNSRKNNRRNVTFHRFPLSNPKLCKKWVHAICQPGFKPSAHHLLCSDHFKKNCFLPGYVNRRQLKKNAIPTLYHYVEKKPQQQSPSSVEQEPEVISSRREYNVPSEWDEEGAGLLDDQFDSGRKVEEPIKMRTEFFCRVCACTSEELVPVFGEQGLELQLLEKIHIHLPIMVTPEDLLPVALCTSCVYKLEMCHEFVHGCLDADIKLRTILGLQVDHKIYSDDDTTDTEPSMEKEQEQEHYSNIYEDSPDQAFENHTQVIINSEEADGKLDRRSYRKVPSVLARQNTELHVKRLDDIKYEAHGFDHYSDGKLDCTEYTDIQTEQNTEVCVKGVVDRKYEARNFDHYSGDKLDCAEYADIQTEQNTEMDAENVNETECEADTENVNETECEADNFTQEYDLQNTEVQEGSYDVQIHDHVKRSKPSAASMELRSGRAVKKVTLKTKKPKFKVIVVKMKNAENMTHTGKFKETLGLVMNAKEEELASSKNLLAEIQLHTDELPYECTYCGKRYRLRRQLANHRLIHANSRLHKCPVCGKGFNRQQHLRTHVRTHQKSLKYTCKVCRSPFLSVGELIVHRKTHTQEEIEEASKQQVLQGRDPLAFVCQICGKQLASKFTLKNHVMMHADDKPFICEICGKSFTMKSTLHTHHRVHTGERPHSCQHCGEAFLSRQNLIVHERIHTGETPFKCAQCDKAYRSRHSLRQHLLFHADYRPHECQECGKKFRRQDILVTHIRTHTGERPFACNVCGRAFKQRGDCNKHQQRHAL